MRKLILGLAFAIGALGPAAAAECPEGSNEVLTVEDWLVRLGEIADNGTRPLSVELTLRNTGEQTLTLVDGDVLFFNATGELLAAAPIEPSLRYAAGGLTKGTSTHSMVNDPLERLIRASRADVLAQACVTHVEYEGGGGADF